ncbi:amidase [Guptibacillus algicola]|uniref:amidase n=1 Tax=Guptibacillus algicola TaxID=225844 RepID=UPI001CD245BF|nr:amidase [Alkalihalobacillus algicola]MCA0985785.1 amidase [Alkalihalobacillus algicola]
MEIVDLSAMEMAKLIEQRKISPVDVVSAHLARINSLNNELNMFVSVFEEEALEDAKSAEYAIMKGVSTGPLHGVPIALKDLTPVIGRRTTFGSELFNDHIPVHEPTMVKRIRQSGAIIIGKTNTPEFGHKGTTSNQIVGTTKNPWNKAMTAGGSSGGSGAAVASKCVPIAEGSDGGGSIRIPASFNGILGLKPTFGRVPFDSSPFNRFGTTQPYVHYGPMSRTVEDSATLLSVMEGYEANDPYSVPLAKEDLLSESNKGIKGMTFAYTRNYGLYECEPEVSDVIEKILPILEHHGAKLVKIPIDFGLDLTELISFFNKMWFAGLASAYGSLYDRNPSDFSPSVASMIEEGRKISAVELRKTEELRTVIWNNLQHIYREFDCLLSPVLGVAAFKHDIEGPEKINGKTSSPISDWMMTQLYNCTGHPAASIPVGFTPQGMPIGLQASASKFNDSILLRIAKVLESELGVHSPTL